MYQKWNSIKDFNPFGVNHVAKECKKTPLEILLKHPAVFMAIDVVNRYINGKNVFDLYDDKFKLVISNLQDDENALSKDLDDIVTTFINIPNAEFTSKVDNKYGIHWQYVMTDGKLIESIFDRKSKFVNLTELQRYINDNDELSNIGYLILYMLKDKTLRKSEREEFVKAIITQAKSTKTVAPLIDLEAICTPKQDNTMQQQIDELKNSLQLLRNDFNQLVQVMRLMKKDIDSLKDRTSTEIPSMFESFGY